MFNEIRDLKQMEREELRTELVMTFCALFAAMQPAIVLAGSSGSSSGLKLNATPIWEAIRTVIALATVGVAIMFIVQKSTAKMIVTLLIGGFLYFVATKPESALKAIGGIFGNFIGVK